MHTAVKQGEGRQLNDELVAAKALAKAQREGVREHASNVNALKKLIDQLQVRNKIRAISTTRVGSEHADIVACSIIFVCSL